MKYKNIKTGIIIDVVSPIKSDTYQKVTEPKKKKPVKKEELK